MKERISAVLFVISVSGTAQAGLITSSAGLADTSVITFDAFAGLGYNFSIGPVQIGGPVGQNITWTSNNIGTNTGAGSVLGEGSYGLGSNGVWGLNGQTYTGVDGGVNTAATIHFLSGPVSAVGGFVNYCPNCGLNPLIEALGLGDVVLDSYDLAALAPISTPNAVNAGAFRGIEHDMADILGFRVSNSYFVLDDLTFSSSTVPEPGTLTLVGFGAAAIGLRRRKARS